MTGRFKGRWWGYASVVALIGTPVLMLTWIVVNLVEASHANERAAESGALRAQIITQLAKRQMRGVKPLDVSSLYLASKSSSRARAEAQAKVSALVESAGGHLAEIQFTSTPEQEAGGIVAVQASLTADNKALFDLLYAIESGLPLMTVVSLNARKVDAKDGAESANGTLQIDLNVESPYRVSSVE